MLQPVHYCYNYPVEFDNYIRKTLTTLLNEQSRLINLSNNSKTSENKSINLTKKHSIDFNRNKSEKRYIVKNKNCLNNVPKLMSLHNNEIVYINRDIFYIGRNKETSDLYIKNHLINYNHAYIIRKDKFYYLVDNHSINGTFLNSQKINYNDEVPLNNGDLITFSKEKFVFLYK